MLAEWCRPMDESSPKCRRGLSGCVRSTTRGSSSRPSGTFLAWIRTSLALMGFGFLIARFVLLIRKRDRAAC